MGDTEPGTDPVGASRRSPGLLIAVGALVIVLVIGTGAYLLARDDETSTTSAATTTTSRTASSTSTTKGTSTSPSPTSTTASVPVDTSAGVWPFASSSTRYQDPAAAARGFAIDYAGFTDPIVGAFRPGDARSGEVPVQSRAQGPTTTVQVRQLGDSWWVLGASTPNIQVTSPLALATISSPVRLLGTSTAYEATVNVEVRDDAGTQPIGTGIVMGGANGTMGSFEGTVLFNRPSTAAGAVTLLTRSPQDNRVTEVTTVRVKFA